MYLIEYDSQDKIRAYRILTEHDRAIKPVRHALEAEGMTLVEVTYTVAIDDIARVLARLQGAKAADEAAAIIAAALAADETSTWPDAEKQ